jgi:hypothetical protein
MHNTHLQVKNPVHGEYFMHLWRRNQITEIAASAVHPCYRPTDTPDTKIGIGHRYKKSKGENSFPKNN